MPDPGPPVIEGVPQPGEALGGKYRVDRVLGMGGAGVVVQATHTELDERVAIKFLLPAGASDPVVRARFAREARAAVKIKSEHVARVIDVGALDSGAPFMVMEYLDGSDLAAVLDKRGLLPIGDAVDFVLQACEAIAEAHALGIVHRDLKPANLFLTQRADGSHSVKVLDFGISKMSTQVDAATTNASVIMGSPSYMSPEQLKSSADVDARTDVWSLGVILYELLTGGVPFKGASLPHVVAAILSEPPRPVRAARSDVPEALETAIDRCLTKDPWKRFSSVAALAQAIAPFAPGGRGRASAERISRVISGTARESLLLPATLLATSGSSASEAAPMAVTRDGSTAFATDDTGAGTPNALAIHKSKPPGPRDARAVILAVALSTLGAGGFALVLMQGNKATPAALPPEPTTSTVTASVLDATTEKSLAPAPSAVASVAMVSASSVSSAPPTSSALSITSATRPPLVRAPRPTAQPQTPPRNCTPPFTVDATGIKHAKPECM